MERKDEVDDERMAERREDLHLADHVGDGLLLQTLPLVRVLHGVHLVVALPPHNAHLTGMRGGEQSVRLTLAKFRPSSPIMNHSPLPIQGVET